ncbi:amidohydrolase family protein [Chitinophaga pendula]|uniref:amidohydrolase family protein n=1 Tax=Chitinophaga TaxID=79328 RepID=UPI000BAE867F|nr:MULTISPECIES: amidohydrolase family protein [Chitinophaga]ASZ12732.1 amidohydrolase [Chitinophaga sp. MD30]UCJ09650.1 amidohydrolase family protein [Chitinophaga pendula]
MRKPYLLLILLISLLNANVIFAQTTLLKNATLIDGTGKAPRQNTDILIQGPNIAAVGNSLPSKGATVIDLKGKTVIPSFIVTHAHAGTLKGLTTPPGNYSRDNLLRQLIRYQDYGITQVLAMGTDRPLIFQTGFRDSSVAGLLPGARLHSAGYGFTIPGGAPPPPFPMDLLYRPANAGEVPAQMEQLAKVKPAVVKIWVDDFGGGTPKMTPEVYTAIIWEAHRHHLRVASHLYYLEDARKLIAAGVDIIAHSIRDKDVDQDILQAMKQKGVIYIPTLSLDEYAYIYARRPEWIDDAFFKAALEPGVYEMITAEKYQQQLQAGYDKNLKAFKTAQRNLKKIHDAGILVSFGTDSGANPVRAQGFSEHLELELMVQAGLTPVQAITVATGNAARTLKIDRQTGTIEKGKLADLLILDGNPADDIKNTRKITAVYKAGQQVSQGPLEKNAIQ